MNSKSNHSDNLDSQLIDINHNKHSRWGWLVLLIGIGGFFIWASTAPLDQGVGAQGMVVVSGNRKAVQPISGGKIISIDVKDGDAVKKGQPLVKMDDTQAKAQLEIAKSQWYSTAALEARLLAERDSKAKISFPAHLASAKLDRRAANAMELQSQLFFTRQRALSAELTILSESMAGLEYQAKGLWEGKKSKEEQLRLLKEQLIGQRELAKEGYLPRNRLLEQERVLAQISGAISEDIGNIGRTQQGISEIKARMAARRNDFRREVESQLTEVQRDSAGLKARVEALTLELDNTIIRSPSEGVVMGMTIHTIGGVVPAGSLLMDIVPKDEPLKIEIQIMPNLIDKVKKGLEVDVLFTAFQQSVTPHVTGRILDISADVLVDPKHGTPYFKADVWITPENLKKLHAHEIRAGMPVEVFIKTGERTMLNYLVKPLTDRIHGSLSEE